nr:NAD(P)/FAD-dependent oxidoreductase [uncultured Sphingorhabdus sp.]
MPDCVIIGGGPAGLTAAIYLSRFHLDVTLIDAGQSRALWIPKTHNHAGFPGGITGAELLGRMRTQAELYGTQLIEGRVSRISKNCDIFTIEYGQGEVQVPAVLLATGVVNRRPDIDQDLHARALAQGRIRYCPVCDGFEVTDQNVGVIGTGAKGVAEAIFLRSFTNQVALLSPNGSHDFDDETMKRASDAGITCLDGPAIVQEMDEEGIFVRSAHGTHRFDCVYPALGSDVNDMLARMLGVDCSDTDCVVVDSHQRTSVEGLYAAGDVVLGLDQISHAMGEGGVAAVTIRNDIAKIRPLFR